MVRAATLAAGNAASFLTSGSSWSVPTDWNNSNNIVEVIGGGGGGGGDGGTATGGGGGGGDAYSKITNITLTGGGSATYAIGTAGTAGVGHGDGGAGGDTYFNGGSCGAASVCAKGGALGRAAVFGGTGGAGGGGGTNYFYRVVAVNANGTSTYSNERLSGSNSGRVIRLGGLRLKGMRIR